MKSDYQIQIMFCSLYKDFDFNFKRDEKSLEGCEQKSDMIYVFQKVTGCSLIVDQEQTSWGTIGIP